MPEPHVRRRRVSIAVHTATQASSSHRTKTTRSEKGKKTRFVVIDDPKALPGASFLTVCCMCLHYCVMAFLFIAGIYHNDYPAPAALFLIPAFMSGVVTVLGLLCFALQRNKYISKLIEPTTGIVVAIMGTAAGAAWCLIIYAPLRNDFTLAIQFTQTSAILFIYFLLVRRRLAFASRAFGEGAHAVARVRAVFFRVLTHSVFLLAYTTGWCILYMRLIDVPPSEEETASGNSTSLDKAALPKFISAVAESTTGFSARWLIRFAKAFLIFNLYVISQTVKASIWMTVSEVATSVAVSAREGVPVILRTGAQLNTKLTQHLPSVFLAGHFLLISQLLRAVGEAFHRCRPRRQGLLHNVGAAWLTAWGFAVHGCSSHGLCRMERTGLNIIKSSRNIRDKFLSTGMHAAVNDDVLFGARVCNYTLLASVSSIFGSLLVEIFQYPTETTLQIAMLCFVSTFCVGNWGMECAEAWVCTLYIEFAEAPETLYVCNPRLAVALHAVLFGCSPKIGEEREKAARKAMQGLGQEEEEVVGMERQLSDEAELALSRELSDFGSVKGDRVRAMSKHFASAPSIIRRYNPNAMAARDEEFDAFAHSIRAFSGSTVTSPLPSRRHTPEIPSTPVALPDADRDQVRPLTPTDEAEEAAGAQQPDGGTEGGRGSFAEAEEARRRAEWERDEGAEA